MKPSPSVGDIWMIDDWGYGKEYYLMLSIRYNVENSTGIHALRLNDGTTTRLHMNMELDNWIFIA